VGFQFPTIANFFNRKKRVNNLSDIYSSDSFRIIIERERVRAERTGHIFSLVIFSSNHRKGNDAALLERLGTFLAQKVRISDEVGWYEEEYSIGALLPGTSAEGAWQFIDIIRKKIGEEGSRLVCTVYTYPKLLNDSYSFIKEAADECDRRSNHMSSVNLTEKSSPMIPNNGKSSEPIEVLVARPITLGKRMFDFFMALLLLILLSPLFLMIAIFIKIVSPGPVFYRQKRLGYLGRPLTMWKFRTMQVNNNEEIHKKHIANVIESDKPVAKLDDQNDDRIIPFGKLLRFSCLDELPQLVNVLRGDMSLIGPRPLLLYEADKLLEWQTRRYDVLPGMSGLWQVNGKNHTTFKQQICYDIQYSRKVSPGLDAKILLLTVPTILRMVFNLIPNNAAIENKPPTYVPSRKDLSLRG
jgi:lipopolysaccharide/colanic/teichoic acid biosynthesis glycosyltransferase